MHPILANRTRTLLYVAAWLPIAALLTQVLARGGTIRVARSGNDRFPDVPALCIHVPVVLVFLQCHSTSRKGRRSTLRQSHDCRGCMRALVGRLGHGPGLCCFGAAFGVEGLESRYRPQILILLVSGLLLFLIEVTLNYLLITFESSPAGGESGSGLQVLAREAELRALRAQIDPHFLFNSLNSINALVMTDPSAARTMCVLLADFLRGSLKLGAEQQIPLAEEIRLAETYLNIEHVRFGSRLKIERNIDAQCEACLVPPLIMQPLIENAVTHGIASAVEGGVVAMSAERNGAGVKIVIENPFEL